jgi:hypothetical protein
LAKTGPAISYTDSPDQQMATNSLINVVDKLSITGMGGFLSRQRKCQLTKVARDSAVPHDNGPGYGYNIVIDRTRREPPVIRISQNDAEIHLLNGLNGQN